MSILVLTAAVIMGFTLGLLGGGGSILAVPILVYLAGVDEKVAIATSLLVVGSTSLGAVIGHARAGNVAWRTGLIFGGFSMAGAAIGGQIAKFIPGGVLLGIFAGFMLITAIMMLRGKQNVKPNAEAKKHLPIMKIGGEGLVVGMVTGLVGAGGGFLVVPALVILGGLDMRIAIGTSLLVIGMKSLAGFASFASYVPIDWPLALAFTGAAIMGSFAGSQVSHRIDANKLRKGFAFFVLIMGALILTQKLLG
ncbi:MAG: sulfite exporter TauE/SafE family protein [bacterium]